MIYNQLVKLSNNKPNDMLSLFEYFYNARELVYSLYKKCKNKDSIKQELDFLDYFAKSFLNNYEYYNFHNTIFAIKILVELLIPN